MGDQSIIERLRAMVKAIESGGVRGLPSPPWEDSRISASSLEKPRVLHPEPEVEVSDSPDLRVYRVRYKAGDAPWLQPCLEESLEGFRSLVPGLSDPEDWLYFDIETTGLLGAATFAFLVGFGFWQDGDFSVTQYLLLNRDGEESLLQVVRDAFMSHRTLVTFNGKAFDVPVINSRFAMSGMSPPAMPGAHLDLLQFARNMGRRVEYGCGLKESVRRFAGVSREGDVAGALIPALYFIYEKENDPSVLEQVIKHNRLDVLDMVCLARIFGSIVAAVPDSCHDPMALSGAGKLHYRKGNLNLARKCLENADEGGEFSADKRSLLAQVMRKQGDWDGARRIWENAVSSGFATTEDYLWLARYHELAGDGLAKSLQIVESALAKKARAGEVPLSLAKRKARLERRLRAALRKAKTAKSGL